MQYTHAFKNPECLRIAAGDGREELVAEELVAVVCHDCLSTTANDTCICITIWYHTQHKMCSVAMAHKKLPTPAANKTTSP